MTYHNFYFHGCPDEGDAYAEAIDLAACAPVQDWSGAVDIQDEE
jgi:hypothetical protein